MKSKPTIYLVVGTILALTLVFTGCATMSKGSATGDYTTKDLNEQLVMATLWVQTSAEYRAICYQTFHLAKLNVDAAIASHSGSKPLAVIVDADETVIDNSAYEAFLIGQDFGYSSKTWTPWMAAAEAKAIPGAVEFLNYIEEKGVEIFYITNRKMVGYEGTEKNLKRLGFPYVDKKHLLLRTDTSDKQPRRDIVAKDYEIVLLLGDNLNDFTSDFAKKSIDERFAEVELAYSQWGTKFIVLPNPQYGDWDGAVFKYNWGATAAEKDQMRKEIMQRWDYQAEK
jgi:5'-nucleotidase (lipoprotein e(P4) family)